MTDELTSWSLELEGVCYTREHGWFRPLRGDDGKILRASVPAEVIEAAGLSEHPGLSEGITMLILQSKPLENLILREGD